MINTDALREAATTLGDKIESSLADIQENELQREPIVDELDVRGGTDDRMNHDSIPQFVLEPFLHAQGGPPSPPPKKARRRHVRRHSVKQTTNGKKKAILDVLVMLQDLSFPAALGLARASYGPHDIPIVSHDRTCMDGY